MAICWVSPFLTCHYLDNKIMFDLAATDFPQGSCPALITLAIWWIRSLGIEFVHLVLVWQEHIDQRQLIDNSHAGGICLFYEGIHFFQSERFMIKSGVVCDHSFQSGSHVRQKLWNLSAVWENPGCIDWKVFQWIKIPWKLGYRAQLMSFLFT